MAGPAAGAAQLHGSGPRDKPTGTVLRLCVSSAAQDPTSSGMNAGISTTIVGGLDIFEGLQTKPRQSK